MPCGSPPKARAAGGASTGMSRRSRRKRVAVIGGGCAGLAAAFELSRPENGFDVTVFQQGFRLGGKGASGRGPAGRIEEHGLHVWMGYYENAFRLMRDCYEELQGTGTTPYASWRDAFLPASHVSAADPISHGGWSSWNVRFPENREMPADPTAPTKLGTIGDYLARALELVITLVATSLDVSSPPPAHGQDGSPRALIVLRRLLGSGAALGVAGLLEALHALKVSLAVGLDASLGRTGAGDELLPWLDRLGEGLQGLLASLLSDKPGLGRLMGVVEIVLATLRGSLRARLLEDPRGFDALDDYDTRAWLRQNGASEEAVQSSFVRALYDLGFAFEDGDLARPRIAAGAGLRGSLRAFFTYRGAFFWKMKAGMGDVVFAPLYLALSRRGVRFRFFHRLTDVHLAGGPGAPPFVESLDFRVQARPRGGHYEPLVDVGGLPCWPSQPVWTQLEDGHRPAFRARDFEAPWDAGPDEELRLRWGRDFDFVVLATGVGALPYVAPSLLARDERWRHMHRRVKTVPTRAFQLWLSPSLAELGWKGPPPSLTAFAAPFDTWADMTHLLPRETWPHPPPRALAYFCSVLPDRPVETTEDAARATAEVKDDAIAFLDREIGHLWPAARSRAGGFRFELLVSPEGPTPRTPAAAFATQYWRANVTPSDRYTLSLPGSIADRLSPLDVAIDNLTVAGDWTASGLNLGCVEGAVMSGLLAAHALCQSPSLSAIVGFDHP